jgi:predicted nuclease with RNAse H fold
MAPGVYRVRVLTVGIDLAAEPEGTAVARVEWLSGRAVIRDVSFGADDATILAAVAEADKAGIDCPLGWPDAFVSFVTAHQGGQVTVPWDLGEQGWRRPLTMRLTDAAVREVTRLVPLSVSADRLGHVAMRCACLLAVLGEQGHPVDRSGSGKVAEVYPAASLKMWHLPHHGYKRPGDTKVLHKLVDELAEAAPWLDFSDTELTCRARHDATDAVVAALTARAANLNLVMRPRTPQEESAARTEGWIAIPLPGSRLGQLP